jgi:SSS family solute:Na+ symporter
MLVAYIFIFLPTVLYSGTLAFADITGVNFWLVLLTTVVLIGVYTVRGGLAAVVWTDVAQCVMLLGGGLVLFFVALSHIPGGWATMVHANPERFHLIRSAGDPYAPFLGLLAASLGVFLFYNASNQVMIQRVLGARTQWDGLMGIVFSGFINLLRPLVTCFLGFIVFYYCTQRGEMLSNPNLTFSFAVKTFGTTGLRGIILAGFLAAVMGASSALVNSAATIFTLDIYGKSINCGAAEARKILVGRVASVAVLVTAAAWCPLIGLAQTIFTYFQTGITYLATPIIAVILVGIFWRRPGALAGSVGLMGGLAIQIIVAIGAKLLFATGHLHEPLHWLYVAFAAEVLTVLLIIMTSLATAPAPAEGLADLIWRPSLVWGHQGPPQPWYKNVLLWYLVYSSLWFSVYYHFR